MSESRPGQRGGERVAELQAAMGDLDALVLRLPENVVFSSGYAPQLPGQGLVLVPPAGPGVLLCVEWEAPRAADYWAGEIRTFASTRTDRPAPESGIEALVRDWAREHDLAGAAVGWEGSFELIAPPIFAGDAGGVARPTRELIERAFATKRILDATTLVERVRAAKDPYDLERLRVVNAVAGAGLRAFEEMVHPGVTEVELAAAVESAILKGAAWRFGTVDARGYAVVSSGAALHDGWQYFRSRGHRIERGDAVMLELGTVVDGYWSDHTRTAIAGTPSGRQDRALEAVKGAALAAFAACRPGVRGGEIDAVARAAVCERGLEQFPHHTGHGVGFRYHESVPRLTPDSTDVLRAGMVVATEPGLYGREHEGGFRHEDNAIVTAQGADVISVDISDPAV